MKSYIQSSNIEIRVAEEGKLFFKAFLPTEKLSHFIYHKERKIFFKEKVSSGAYSKAIDKKNLKILLQHDYSKELVVEDMDIFETVEGLSIEATIVPNMELIEAIAGDKVNGVSYGFVVENDVFEMVRGEWIRSILSFNKIMEVSILHSKQEPCYPSASAILSDDRVMIAKEEIQAMKDIISRIKADTINREVEQIREELDKLKRKGKY